MKVHRFKTKTLHLPSIPKNQTRRQVRDRIGHDKFDRLAQEYGF